MYIEFELPSFDTLTGWTADKNYTGPHGQDIDRFIATYKPTGGRVVVDRNWDGEYLVEKYHGDNARRQSAQGPGHSQQQRGDGGYQSRSQARPVSNDEPDDAFTTNDTGDAVAVMEEFMADINPQIEWGAAYARSPQENEIWQYVPGRESGNLVQKPGPASMLALVNEVLPSGVCKLTVVYSGPSESVPNIGHEFRMEVDDVATNPEWVYVPDEFQQGIRWLSQLEDRV